MSRADLLRVWYSADGDGPDAAKWLANELDFEFVPPQPQKVDESADLDFAFDPPPEPIAAPARPFTVQPVARAVQSLWLPSKYLVGKNLNDDPQIELPAPVAELAWTRRPVALPPIGLATWPEAKTRLIPILEPPRRTPRIDIDKLVDLMSQGRLLKKMPTETHFRLERNVWMLEDRSVRLTPYHNDQRWLIDLLKNHLPRGYCSHLACHDPRRIVDPNRSIDQATRSLENLELLSGCQVLLLSDLGILDSSSRLQGIWHDWIQEQSQRDCRISVMVPFALDRVPSGFREIVEFYSWQHSDVVSVLDRKIRDELVAEILSRLSPSSSFDTVLLRWVRQAVSEASDAALESFVWQDKSLDSNQYSSAKNDRIEAKREFRNAFQALDSETKRGVLNLLRESRAALGEDPSLWFVELLSLTPEELNLVEGSESDFEDVQRAIRYMDDHRGRQEVGGSIRSFLSWLSKRVESDGVWASYPWISETIRRWQREFHPTRTLDAKTRIGEINTAVHAPGEITCSLRATEKGLSIRKESAGRWYRGDTVLLGSTVRILEIHRVDDPERAFWKSGRKPEWVSDFGTDQYGAWCEFQVPRHVGTGAVTQRMRWIKPGEFMMGSPEEEIDRNKNETLHHVKLSQGYWIADTPVTQELWMAITGDGNPSYFKGENNPVENVSWEESNDWIGRLSNRHNSLQLELPTEAQWEYACRAGSNTAYCFGDHSQELPAYGWFGENSDVGVSPVKMLRPNRLGLYDMHGNVWEWCQDCYGDFDSESHTDPIGLEIGPVRVIRGGSWFNPARSIRSASRTSQHQQSKSTSLGFRLLSSSLGAEPNERAMLPEAEPGTERAISVQVIVKPTEPVRDPLEARFWKLRKKPDWVSAYGKDDYGLWYEFQLPNRWPETQANRKDRTGTEPLGFVTQRMRWIKPGTFTMGSDVSTKDSWWGDETQHEVILTRGFWMADTPCTQGAWMGVSTFENPSRFKGFSNPVEQVSWNDCQSWLKGLGDVYPLLQAVLPNEAQWEYACRAGSSGAYCFGDQEQELEKYAWYDKNSNGTTHPVCEKLPSKWGLYDVHGNVWEWCQDRYGEFTKATVTDPVGPAKNALRVIRGGGWSSPARLLRSACRLWYDPGDRFSYLGFRLLSSALVAEPSEPAMLPEAEQGTERVRIGSAERVYEFLRSVDLDATGNRSPEEEFTEIDVNAYTSIRVVSDQEGYQFDQLEKPDWAVDFGSDAYGLYATFEVNSVRQRMRWIPPGRFVMGTAEGKDYGRGNEGPQHEVILTHGYWMFDTPVTQGLWTALMGDNPSYFPDLDRPVEQVRWEDAVGFAQKLNEWFGKRNKTPSSTQVIGWSELSFRLPTEAQWEYACRAGTNTDTYLHDLEILGDANAPLLDRIGWYGGNSGREYDLQKSFSLEQDWLKNRQYPDKVGGTRKVYGKEANGWGLYDMLGNVWEWCEDWYGEYTAEGATDPVGPSKGSDRVVRGGSWDDPARNLRSACRLWFVPGFRSSYLGFRLLSSAGSAKR